MDIFNLIGNVISKIEVQTLAYLIAANVVLGLARAVIKGQFELAKLADFARTVIMVFGAYLGVAIASVAMADFKEMRDVAWLALIGVLLVKIKDNLKDLGIPVPEKLNKLFNRS